MLRFIKHHTSDFKNIFTIKTLYATLISSQIENYTMICNLYYLNNYWIRLFKPTVGNKNPVTSDQNKKLYISALVNPRLNSLLKCCSQVPIQTLRNCKLFFVDFYKTRYGQNIGIIRMNWGRLILNF